MPLKKGFRGRIPCPLWLLDHTDAAFTIVPLAETAKAQANPLYHNPPGAASLAQEPPQKILNHIGVNVNVLISSCTMLMANGSSVLMSARMNLELKAT